MVAEKDNQIILIVDRLRKKPAVIAKISTPLESMECDMSDLMRQTWHYPNILFKAS